LFNVMILILVIAMVRLKKKRHTIFSLLWY
jgi:hypothetical protein